MYGKEKNELSDFEVKTKEELRRLFGKADIIGIMKSSRIR